VLRASGCERILKCRWCGKDVPADDPTYPKFHYKCNEGFLKKLETLKIIKHLVILGPQLMYSLDDSFEEILDRELEDARHYIATDETVDDDIVTMIGVVRAVGKYVPEGTETEGYGCSEFVFNSLMMEKYGTPVPEVKRFHSRIEEYAREVHTMPVDETTVCYLKAFKKMGFGT